MLLNHCCLNTRKHELENEKKGFGIVLSDNLFVNKTIGLMRIIVEQVHKEVFLIRVFEGIQQQ